MLPTPICFERLVCASVGLFSGFAWKSQVTVGVGSQGCLARSQVARALCRSKFLLAFDLGKPVIDDESHQDFVLNYVLKSRFRVATRWKLTCTYEQIAGTQHEQSTGIPRDLMQITRDLNDARNADAVADAIFKGREVYD